MVMTAALMYHLEILTFYSICAHRLVHLDSCFVRIPHSRGVLGLHDRWHTAGQTNILLCFHFFFGSFIRRLEERRNENMCNNEKLEPKMKSDWDKIECTASLGIILYSTIHASWLLEQFEHFRSEDRLSGRIVFAPGSDVGHFISAPATYLSPGFDRFD